MNATPPPFVIPESKKQTNGIGIIIQKCLYHWPLFIIGLLFSGVGLFIYLKIAKPVYEARASLIIKNENKSANDKSPLQEIDVLSFSRIIENELEILKSKQLIEKVVNDLKLDIIYQKVDGITSEDLYKNGPVTFTLIDPSGNYEKGEVTITIQDDKSFLMKMPDGNSKAFPFRGILKDGFGTWKLEPTADLRKYKGSVIKISVLDPDKLATVYQARIAASLSNKLSTTVVLSIDDQVPQRGKDIINRLIYNYSLSGQEEKIRETESALHFIDKRLDSLSVELNTAEKGIETFKSARGLTDISADSRVRLENMQANDTRLNDVNVQLTVIQGVERYINSTKDLGKVPSVLGIEDPALASLIEKLAQIQLQRERLLATTPETNPDFEPINRQISTLKAAIKENIVSIRTSLENTQAKLQSYNTGFESSIKNIPTQEREYITIKRQQGIKESLYTYLLQKREEVAVSNANTLAADRIVDKAYVGSPKGKMKSLALLAAILLGLGLPAGFIYIRTMMSPEITDLQEIRESVAIPVLGELPLQPAQGPIAVNDFSSTVIGEQFRALRIKLHYLFGEKEHGRVTLVTSSVPGEGKSFVSSNLGIALALAGRKTIILELDLRKPKIAKTLNLPETHPGMSDFLKGKATQGNIIQSSGLDSNLDIISSGSPILNPSELLERKQLRYLIESLKNIYDDIIIDSPPLHLVPDAMILSRLSDITLYMMRQGFTERAELDFIKELNSQKQLVNTHIIFNGIQRQKYGYGYNYDLSYYSQQKSGIGSIFSDFSDRF